MKVETTSLQGVIVLTPKRWTDERGYFSEVFNRQSLLDVGVDLRPVQENQSLSRTVGTVRGLHFQRPPTPQAKLVRVLRGRILDVAVDIRAGSATFGHAIAVELSSAGGEQMFIPAGFAHGFCTLEPDTEISYLVDAPYAPECDSAILWNDPSLGIAWPDFAGAVVSDKDARAPRLSEIRPAFP
jgi:dTDP-4-dehydrorhamnose 3,5-epimerase